MDHDHGAGPPPPAPDRPRLAPIRYGPRDTQVLHPDIASDMLWLLCQRNRKLFAELLSQAMIEGKDGAT